MKNIKVSISYKGTRLYSERGAIAEMLAGYQQTREQDAAHIVKCVNAHDDLVAALDAMLVSAEGRCVTVGDCKQARAALAKAGV